MLHILYVNIYNICYIYIYIYCILIILYVTVPSIADVSWESIKSKVLSSKPENSWRYHVHRAPASPVMVRLW